MKLFLIKYLQIYHKPSHYIIHFFSIQNNNIINDSKMKVSSWSQKTVILDSLQIETLTSNFLVKSSFHSDQKLNNLLLNTLTFTRFCQ